MSERARAQAFRPRAVPAAPPHAHAMTVRVYYEDTDAAGVVYYANYLRYAERARSELLRAAGIESSTLMAEHGVAIAVRRCEADYLRPARLDDLLEVRSRLIAIGGATLEGEQRFLRSDDEIAVIRTRLACMDAGGRPKRLPADVRRRLEQFCKDER